MDVFRRPRAGPVGIGAEGAGKGVPDACFREHARDLAHGALVGGHGTERLFEVRRAAEGQASDPVDRDVRSHAGTHLSVSPGAAVPRRG
jgi:hypothetical protein